MTATAYDFTDIRVEYRVAPWDSRHKIVQATFNDPRLKGYSATMIADTLTGALYEGEGDEGKRVSTMVVHFPRIILSEVNTHRVFSRNSASSRARSLKSTVSAVMSDPYIPLFTTNEKGMTGTYADDDTYTRAKTLRLKSRDMAVLGVLSELLGVDYMSEPRSITRWEELIDLYTDMYKGATSVNKEYLNIHKQHVNRLLEPFMWHETIITSAYWENFFTLRLDSHAQPEMQALAHLMYAVREKSVPEVNALHAPFVDTHICVKDMSYEALMRLLMLSASECARISYKDKSHSQGANDDDTLAVRLLASGHMSPFEHQALNIEYIMGGSFDSNLIPHLTQSMVENHDYTTPLLDSVRYSNLGRDWIQLRKIVEK